MGLTRYSVISGKARAFALSSMVMEELAIYNAIFFQPLAVSF